MQRSQPLEPQESDLHCPLNVAKLRSDCYLLKMACEISRVVVFLSSVLSVMSVEPNAFDISSKTKISVFLFKRVVPKGVTTRLV